jgi:heat shock protein HslJ
LEVWGEKSGLLSAVLLASVTVIAGCDSDTSFEDVALEDTDWVMESYGEAGRLQFALPGVEVTLFFDSAEGVFNGYTGINYYGGRYQLDGKELSFPEGIPITELAGNPIVQQQEQEYISMLRAADSFEIVDSKLHIICDGGLIIYHKK